MSITRVAYGGGALRGCAALGVYQALSESPNYAPTKFVGTSAGSINVLMEALGYTPAECKEIMMSQHFTTLITGSSGTLCIDELTQLVTDVKSLVENYGLFNADALDVLIESYIENKLHIKNATFADFPVDITFVCCNLSTGGTVTYLNKQNTPDLPLSKAARMSYAVPIIFTPVLYNGHYYIDGGTDLLYPLTYLGDLSTAVGVDYSIPKHNVKINNVLDFISAFLTAQFLTNNPVNELALDRTIIVDYDGNSIPTQFEETPENKLALYNTGYEAAKKWLQNH